MYNEQDMEMEGFWRAVQQRPVILRAFPPPITYEDHLSPRELPCHLAPGLDHRKRA